MNEVHILNGDCLLDQLQVSNCGKYVIRECFIDGDVSAVNLDKLFAIRERFFKEFFQAAETDYRTMFLDELDKIKKIPSDSVINLWFEFDLFCQTNFWFALNFIQKKVKYDRIYLLLESDDINSLCNMWMAYQESDWGKMKKSALELKKIIPKIELVVQAHIDRFPNDNSLGRPQQVLKTIVNSQENLAFGEIFKTFNASQGIYGFGDLQVKQMLSKIIS